MNPEKLDWPTLSTALRQFASSDENLDDIAQLLGDILPWYLKPSNYRKYFEFWQDRGFHLIPVHYYNPIPDTRDLHDGLWTSESKLPGLDMRDAAQLDLLHRFASCFKNEYNDFPLDTTDVPHEFYFNNPMFGGTDALVLYCMVRYFRPDLVIEVGSGFSSRIIAKAALKNQCTQLVSIEPYPDDILKNGFPGLTRLIPTAVQDLDITLFDQLGDSDILFIDSSHVVKIGGDVNYLFLEVLPRLKPGVMVHVHDICLPREYRRDWVMGELRFWTEQYILQAFLAFNSEFDVILSNSYLECKYPEELRAAFPRSPWWGGGSFWLRRH